MIDTIKKYFPNLSELQVGQFESAMRLYPEWNGKINVISRKDIDNLEVNHILHSLSIARFLQFSAGSNVLDFGAGGGLPSIPLAILFPDVKFHLVDRVGKKLKVAKEIADAIGLENVSVQHGDISECRDKFDFIVSRAVMPLPDLIRLSRKNVSRQQRNALPNGLITLKGGDISAELSQCGLPAEVEKISQWFPDEEFFSTKLLVYVPMS